ncbi:putative F-box protein, partial [Trifolium medium]|nr:putative F-box protein [Trifolium medium]
MKKVAPLPSPPYIQILSKLISSRASTVLHSLPHPARALSLITSHQTSIYGTKFATPRGLPQTRHASVICSPFRIDILDPKDSVETSMEYPRNDEACKNLEEELRMSWIVIDPRGKRAVNVSSGKPVSVHRHWLTGDV